jgi:hypothetical protein
MCTDGRRCFKLVFRCAIVKLVIMLVMMLTEMGLEARTITSVILDDLTANEVQHHEKAFFY